MSNVSGLRRTVLHACHHPRRLGSARHFPFLPRFPYEPRPRKFGTCGYRCLGRDTPSYLHTQPRAGAGASRPCRRGRRLRHCRGHPPRWTRTARRRCIGGTSHCGRVTSRGSDSPGPRRDTGSRPPCSLRSRLFRPLPSSPSSSTRSLPRTTATAPRASSSTVNKRGRSRLSSRPRHAPSRKPRSFWRHPRHSPSDPRSSDGPTRRMHSRSEPYARGTCSRSRTTRRRSRRTARSSARSFKVLRYLPRLETRNAKPRRTGRFPRSRPTRTWRHRTRRSPRSGPARRVHVPCTMTPTSSTLTGPRWNWNERFPDSTRRCSRSPTPTPPYEPP